jgi:hypothetical protein
MEIAVAAVAAQDHDMLMNYLLIIAAIPFSITCVVVTLIAIVFYVMLWMGFPSVVVLILNVQICVLTGMEPGTGMDGMYAIADITAVSLIVRALYHRPPNVDRGSHDDEDENEDEDDEDE